MMIDSSSPSETVPSASATPTPEPEPALSLPQEELDPITRAERTKEQGNASFRLKKYAEAIDFYSQAIGTSQTPGHPHTVALIS